MSFDSRESSTYNGQPVECFRFAQGANLWLWTSADEPITLPTGTYQPDPGLSCSEMEYSQEDGAGAIDIILRRDNPLAKLFIGSVPATAVSLTVYQQHRGDTEVVAVFVGTVGEASFQGSEARFRCEPIDQAFELELPVIPVQILCAWGLYGTGCGVDPLAFRDTAIVSGVSGKTVTSSAFSARPDGWFTNGYLEDGAGARQFITAHVGGTVTLLAPLPGLISGSTVYAFAGCDRTEATCISKFNNLVNHMGFARMPISNPFHVRIG